MTHDKSELPSSVTAETTALVAARREIGRTALTHEYLDQWHSQRMLFVSGPHASGKSSVTRASLERSFSIFDLGPLIHGIHKNHTSTLSSYAEWVEENEAIYGQDYTSEVLVQAIRPELEGDRPPNGTAIVGNRSILGIEYFKKKFKPSDSRIIYFEAPSEILAERYRKREKQIGLGDEEFQTLLDQDMKMGLGSVRENADFIIQNTSSFEVAKAKLIGIVDSWQPLT